MSMNVKRFILKIQAVAIVALGLLGYAAAPVRSDTPKVTMAPGQIVVKAAPGMSEADVRALASEAKCDFLRAIPYNPGYYVVRLSSYAGKTLPGQEEVTDEVKTAMTALKARAGVSAEPNLIRHALRDGASTANKGAKSRASAPPSGLNVTPDDPIYPQQWGLVLIRMPEAWAIQVGAQSIVIGVADTGIDLTHEDFKTPDGTGSRIVASANFVAGGTSAQDGNGHGTNVAGIASATANNTKGVASVSGWNRGGVDIKLAVARVLGDDGSGTIDAEVAGIGYLIDQKVNVINLSLGGGASDTEAAAVKRAIDANIIVVAAAGNEGVDSGVSPSYPASLPDVISVTAVGRNKERSFFTNYGGNAAIAAPGGDDPTGADQSQQIWSTFPVNGYATEQGTSQATPHVAGAVALWLAAGAPQSVTEITRIMKENAQPLTSDVNLGAGLLDVYTPLLLYADPPFSVALNGAQDRGAYYSSQVAPLSITAVGVTKAPASGAVKVTIYGLPNTKTLTFVEGTDFTIPRTIPSGQPKATPFTVQVPANGKIDLAPGRYKAVLTVNDVVQGTQFFDVIGQTQPRGRTMFAFPFRVREVSASNPEQTVFGFSTTFSLARYNTLRTQQSSGDYFLWQSAGVKESGASFSATATNSQGQEIPITYESTNSAVSIAPVGLGYWLDLTDPVNLNTLGSAVTTPVYIRLFAANGGWNMVGAPFTGATGWGTVSVEQGGVVYGLDEAIRKGFIASALIGYENGDYVYSIYPYGEMQPFKGYWVKAYADCTLVIAPSSASRKVAPPVRRGLPPVEGWRARLSARVSGDSDGQNYFGQARGAKDEADALDVLKPPTGGGHSYLRFVSGKDDSRAVANAFDMRSPDSAKAEWMAAVSSDRTNADVTITWDNLGSAPRRAGFTLTDTVTGAKVDMRSRSSYTFRSGDAGSTRYLKVSMTPTLSGGPLAISGMTVAGGRSAGDAGFSVRFTTTAEADITGAVKSLNGKVVADLSGTTRATAGTINTLRWDGRSRSGGVLPPGPYLVEVTARSADGQTVKSVQPIQNLR